MPTKNVRRALVLGTGAAAMLIPATAGAQTRAQSPSATQAAPVHVFRDDLTPVGNNPPADAKAFLIRRPDSLTAVIVGLHLSPDVPHAIHIHGELQAANECPTAAADQNGDGLVDTLEGLPSYGPIDTTFTTSGGTSGGLGPDALDLSRAPVANAGGVLVYQRTIPIKDTVAPGEEGIPRAVADDLAHLHIVVHGADLNANGKYDFGPGTSSLSTVVGAPVPLEAELPVACGKIQG